MNEKPVCVCVLHNNSKTKNIKKIKGYIIYTQFCTATPISSFVQCTSHFACLLLSVATFI